MLRFSLFILLLAMLIIINHGMVYYGYVQARGQLEIIWNSVPVAEVLQDPGYPDSLKAKLKWIEEVKVFAVRELGLSGMKNYTKYYDQKGEELMWVVSGCAPFKLEAYKWKFPILGEFSYKGFFRREMALDELEKLKAKGLDARVRTAGGWSTLGILKDPVLSGMLDHTYGSLADLIIHELTHGTIFIRDSLEFNENLASFIGNEGALLFMAEKFGDPSEELEQYQRRLSDRKKFIRYILKGAGRLDSLYNTFTAGMDYDTKLRLKSETIESIVNGLQNLAFHNPEYTNFFNDFTPDNTFFMSYLRYEGGQEVFEKALWKDYGGLLPDYIVALKEKYGR